jgi:hypothetical protein
MQVLSSYSAGVEIAMSVWKMEHIFFQVTSAVKMLGKIVPF